MNESFPLPPVGSTPPPLLPGGARRLGEAPEEQVPIPHAFAALEALLRQPRRLLFQLKQPRAGQLVWQMLWLSLVGMAVYGLVVGTFAGGEQLWIAPLKLVMGLAVSAAICLPSLYIFAGLSGAQNRGVEVVGILAALLLLMTTLLVGLAPVAWIFSESTQLIVWMGALHLVFWAVATIFGVRLLKQGFFHGGARSQAGINVWVLIFLLVALQMTTALRPILGHGSTFFPTEKQFFLAHWTNCLDAAGKAGREQTSRADNASRTPVNHDE